MESALRWPVPDSARQPEDATAAPTGPNPSGSNPTGAAPAADGVPPRRNGGWPLPVKILLAAVVLGFVWSPFLAMLVRLSNLNPDLAPDVQPSGIPDLAPPLTPPAAPPAGGRQSPAPSP